MRFALVVAAMLALGASTALAGQTAQAEPGRAKLQPYLSPSLRQWVLEEGRRVADAPVDAALVDASVRDRLAGQAFTDGDIEQLVLIVMKQAAEDADADLREQMAKVKAENQRKQALRRAPVAMAGPSKQVAAPPSASSPTQGTIDAMQAGKDSLDEQGEQEQLRIQLYQDRRSKLIETLSNLMKKSADTGAAISSNLK